MTDLKNDAPIRRSVTVSLGDFAYRALAGEEDGEPSPERLVRALRTYLHDSDCDAPGWAYPRFLERRTRDGHRLEVTIDERLWQELGKEAERQGVSVGQLTEHAVLYYAAEVNAGRITERILGELDDAGG